MRSVHPTPTRKQIYAAAGRADAAIALSHDPNDDEPRCSWYISRPWTIPSEFRPRNVTWSEPQEHDSPTTAGRGHTQVAIRERHHRQGTDASASSPAIAHENGWLRPRIGSSIAMGNFDRHDHHRTRERRSKDVGAIVLRWRSTCTRPAIIPRGLSPYDDGTTRSNVAAHCTPTTRRTQVGSGVRQRAKLSDSTWSPRSPTANPLFSECTDPRCQLTPSCSTRSSPTASIELTNRSHGGWSTDAADQGGGRDVDAPSPTCFASSVLLAISAASQDKWNVVEI